MVFFLAAACSSSEPAWAQGTRSSPPAAEAKHATHGPLRVHRTNPRYFADQSGQVVFLTGSHTWGNLQDYSYASKPSPAPLDFGEYLAFLKAHNHNFFRLWAWESGFNPNAQQSSISYQPMPYDRPGPGLALDGKPKFDVNRFNQTYFDRLRARVQAARENGIYVSVMLFQGFSIEGKGNVGGDPWKGHPLNILNNVNGIDGGGGAVVHTLANRALTALQEAYVRKVIDTVNDLDNVLFEISNEDTGGPEDTDWQIHFIKAIKSYEAGKPQQHPVGMTVQWSAGADRALLQSPADWISPNARFFENDGRKVVLNDTDHSYFWTGLKADGVAAQRAWVWKNFTRGNQCLFMDPYLDPSHDPGRNSPAGGKPDPYWEPLRQALGLSRAVAGGIDLAHMVPHGELASTGVCLANPGQEYLIYLPKGGEIVVDLRNAPGTFTAEWMEPSTGMYSWSEPIKGAAWRTIKAPFQDGALLHLRRS